MSATTDRTRRPRRTWAAAALAVVVVAGLLHGYRNTNVLTADRLCAGLVPAAGADAVLPGTGRLDAERNGPDDGPVDTECTIEKSSVLVGGGRGRLTVRIVEERGDFAFLDGSWSDPARASFLSGPVTGGFQEHDGWVALPERCWTDEPVFVRAHSTEPVPDTAALSALLTDVARTVAQEEGCGTLPERPGAPRPPRSDPPRPADERRLCDLDDLPVRGLVPAGSKVLDTGQSAPAGLWSCTVFLDEEPGRPARADGYVTYAAARDPLLLAAVAKSPGTHRRTAADGTESAVVGPWRTVLPCGDGGGLYLAMESGLQYVEARERVPNTPDRDVLFRAFQRAATASFDCDRGSAGE
ncbi:hypothetical protein [Streptomyces sp. NPDC049906]|uniref:hypothetical protein n=1 Tax=Streptomyces sp. NPDC049906 TaxID=3155656 RepID=UPI00341E8022